MPISPRQLLANGFTGALPGGAGCLLACLHQQCLLLLLLLRFGALVAQRGHVRRRTHNLGRYAERLADNAACFVAVHVVDNVRVNLHQLHNVLGVTLNRGDVLQFLCARQREI